MKIIIADKISERGIALLKETGWIIVLPAATALAAEIADADGLVVRSATKVNRELLEKAPKLRVIGRAGVGVDNVDMEAATNRGVLVMNTPGGNAVSVAEHTFALMLALARSVPSSNTAIQAGRWEKSSSGVELRGKTLGLIGLGRVGIEVAKRARIFGMDNAEKSWNDRNAVMQGKPAGDRPLGDAIESDDGQRDQEMIFAHDSIKF